MSRLTKCNHCTLHRMIQEADRRQVRLIISNDKGWLAVRYSDKKEPSAWFKEITDHCVCG